MKNSARPAFELLGKVSMLALACSSMLILSACKKEILESRNTEVVNNKIYAAGANKPFTGTVTNFLEVNLPFNHYLDSGTYYGYVKETFQPSDQRYLDHYRLINSVCDVEVVDGAPDGETICKPPSSDRKITEMSFKNGKLDGKFKRYSMDEKNTVTSEGSFKDGGLDGELKVYGRNSGMVLRKMNFKNNIPEGKDEISSEESGKLLVSANWSKGKIDGEFIRYSKDGSHVVEKSTNVNGMYEGLVELFDEGTRQKIFTCQFEHGIKNGNCKKWSADGQLINDLTFKNNLVVAVSSPSSPCVNEGIELYGGAAPVELVDEFIRRCAQIQDK